MWRYEKPVGRASRAAVRFRSTVRALREPVLPVLVLAGIVDALSGSPWSHGAMLVGVALLLGLDRIRRRHVERNVDAGHAVSEAGEPAALAEVSVADRPDPRVRFTPLTVIGGVLYAAIVGSFSRFSWPATVAVAAPGALAVAVAWHEPSPRGSESATIEPSGALAWAMVFIVFGLWELANLLLQPSLATGSYAHPTISVLTDPILASHLGRSVFLAVWLASGVFLLER